MPKAKLIISQTIEVNVRKSGKMYTATLNCELGQFSGSSYTAEGAVQMIADSIGHATNYAFSGEVVKDTPVTWASESEMLNGM